MASHYLECTSVATPFGQFTGIWTPDSEVLRASGFGDLTTVARLLPGGSRRLPTRPVAADCMLRTAVEATLDGETDAFQSLRVEQPGKPFHQSCWMVLRQTEPGQRISYANLADRAGRPRAKRMARQASRQNRLGWIVPAHRAVSGRGRLTRTDLGTRMTVALLDWEARMSDDHA